MPGTIIAWLDAVGSTAFTLSAVAFVLLNGAGIATIFLTLDRGFVNRWTSRFLAANLVLLGTGLGIPLMTLAARTAITAVTPAFRSSVQTDAVLEATRAELEATGRR